MSHSGILGYTSSWNGYPYMHNKMPAGYAFPMPDFGARAFRKTVFREVDTTMPITQNNNIVRWRIPAATNSLLDFQRGAVHLTISVGSGTPGANPRISNLAWNCVFRFTVEQGS